MKWPEKVVFCEVGPGDGLLNEPSVLPANKKPALIRRNGVLSLCSKRRCSRRLRQDG